MRQKTAPVDRHTDAMDGPTCSSAVDGPSSVSSVPKIPVAPLCGFADQDGQVLRMPASEVNGVGLNFSHLTNCTVFIRGCPSTVHMSQLANTRCVESVEHVYIISVEHLLMCCMINTTGMLPVFCTLTGVPLEGGGWVRGRQETFALLAIFSPSLERPAWIT